MKKLTKAEAQYKLDQLKKDKIACAIESAATSMVAILLFSGLQFVAYQFPQVAEYLGIIAQVLLIVPLAFWLFMIGGNFWRLISIKRLEKLI